MPTILQLNAQNTVFAAPRYPKNTKEAEAMGLTGGRNKEMRALTIAAFQVAQNNTQLSTRSMNGELLLHLLAGSTTAISHWLSKGRLSPISGGYVLTPAGLAECQNTLLGLAGAYSTTESKVEEWVTRLVTGDHVATQERTFPSSAWTDQRLSNAKNVPVAPEALRPSEPVKPAAGPKEEYDPGDVIDGKFEVRAVLGGGGFSTVYRVFKALEGKEFALKVFNAQGSYEKLKREIEFLHHVSHPHIVRAVWADQTRAGQWYLVTELIDGEALDIYTDGRKKLSSVKAVNVVSELLSALEAIHPDAEGIEALRAKSEAGELSMAEYYEWQDLQNKGIVHRDIKPQNIMLTASGIKLIDFNIASYIGQSIKTMSGTPPYMPPDIALGVSAWDVSPDLFAAGLVLYQLLCVEHPYEGWSPRLNLLPRDPRTFRPDLSPALAEFLLKACAPRREKRFSTAKEMRASLEMIDPLLVSPSRTAGTSSSPDCKRRLSRHRQG